MLANVFTKSLKDRQVATLVGVIGVISVAVLGLWAYSDLDDQIAELYGGLPEGFLALIGLEVITDAGTLILGEIANLMAPMVLSGLAISMGAAAVAGEERRGTIGILLGNPKSRVSVLISKAAAMIVLVTIGAALAGLGSGLTAAAFGTDSSSLHFPAAMLHVTVIALFFGFLALFLGSWTGSSSIATGVSTGVLLISFLAAGLLPLIDSLSNVTKIFPWYYFNSSGPLQNGIDWGHLAVLLVSIAVLGTGAVVGVRRRDLKVGSPSWEFVNQIREHPIGEKILTRLAGKRNVSSIALKSSTDHRTLTTIAAMVMLYTALLVGPMYNAISDVLVDFSRAIPDGLKAMIGFVDMASPEGWYTVEVFSIMLPATFIAVGAAVGARALAGEEENRTMDLLLANPIKRSRVVIEKAVALALIMAVLGLATAAGTWFGSLLGGLDIPVTRIGGATLLGVLLGIFFGFVSLAVSGATGNRRTAILSTAAAGFIAYFANAFIPVNESIAGWARLSPFFYYADGDPLANGINWTNAAVLAVLSLAVLAATLPLFQRRDIRN